MDQAHPVCSSHLNPESQRFSIMIVAGEASGDKHGAALARALKRVRPEANIELFGSGGEEMRAAGVETLVDAREVAIIGVLEIARSLGRLYRAYRTLLEAARLRRPAAIVLIDWPDFNMRLARKLHREAFRTIYYVSPQVWAWRRYRVRALKRDVDRMLVILPFEEQFYRKHGLEVEYVGHPLAEAVRPTLTRLEFCDRYRLDPARPIIALLPGSRQKEIHYHLPVMLQAARLMRCIRGVESEAKGTRPQFVIPLASTVRRADVEANLASAAGSSDGSTDADVSIIENDTYNALCHSDVAVVASGTATVEAALARTPMVIIYRASEINWRLIRPLIHLKTFGMVNLIAGRRIVPELIQHDVSAEKIAREVTTILADSSISSRMRRELESVSEVLAARGGSPAERAARSVIEVAQL